MSKKAKLLTGVLSVAAVLLVAFAYYYVVLPANQYPCTGLLDICHCAGGGIYGCCRALQYDNDRILQGMGRQTVEAVKAGI